MRQSFGTLAVLPCTCVALSFSILDAQAPVEGPKITMSREVRFREHADTAWRSGRIVMVGNCLSLAPLDSFSGEGFLALDFSTVERVEVRDSTASAWKAISTEELESLRSCKQGG
jgi:hypothetical protein